MSSTIYRAAFLYFPDDQSSVVLTRPEHSGLTDDELRAEALAEAQRADIIDMTDAAADSSPSISFPRITRREFDECLEIGDWREE